MEERDKFMKKRILSLFLLLCMLLPLMPIFPTLTVSAQEGALGEVGASTTLYDDISFSETGLPMTYGAFLKSDLAVGGETKDYRTYLMENKNLSWKGAWSMGAVVNGAYEKMEYIIHFGNAGNTATSANADWHTTASGFIGLIDAYMNGRAANIWDAGKVMSHKNSWCAIRFPGNNASAGIGAYAYTAEADGYLGFSMHSAITDTDFTYETAIKDAYVLIRLNDKIIFPENAKLNDKTTWGYYTTITAFSDAIDDIRLQVKKGDVLQFCITEKSGSDPKLGLNPTVSVYPSADATTATSTTRFDAVDAQKSHTFTRGTPSMLLPAWNEANQEGATGTVQDSAETREAYRKYLLTCGKITQTGNWRIGGYNANGVFEPIAYRIPFTTAAFDTTLAAWNNTAWCTTAGGYEYLTGIWVNNSNGNIWGHNRLPLYQMSESGLRTSANHNGTFVYRYTVPANAGGQITPTFAAGSLVSANLRVCIVYDGNVIWPKDAKLSDSTTWHTGFASTEELNEDLDGFCFDVEPGKTLDFCGACVSNTNTKLNVTLTYTNAPTSSVYSEDATFTVGTLPMFYNAFLAEKGMTDGAEAKAAYRTYLLESGRLTWSGAWSRGAVDIATGAYEKLDRMMFMYGKPLDTTAWADARWTTNYTTYVKLVDDFIAGKKPGIWQNGFVIQSRGDTVRFRLPGNEANSGIFAYAYEIPADGGGLVGFSVATDTVGKSDAGAVSTYENIHKMYISVMINGTPVWPKGATRDNTANWANFADVEEMNRVLADVKVYTEAGDLVQICAREKDAGNEYLAFDPVITFYSGKNAVTDFEGNVTLGANLAMSLFAVAENRWVYEAMDVTLNGETVAAAELTENSNLTLKATYSILGIAASEMSDEVTYSFTNRSDGHVYRSGSVSLADLLAQYLNEDEKTADLVKTTLNYGAAAQLYFGYDTEHLANSVLPEADRATPSSIKNGDFTANATVTKKEGAPLHWHSATLLLGDTLRIKLLINADEATDLSSLTLKSIDENGVAVESEWPVIPRGGDTTGKYFKVLIGVPMVDYYSEYKFAVYRNGEQVSDTLTYSVGAYACRVYDKSENPIGERANLNRMVDTILALGAAASAYHEVEHADPMAYADVREIDTGLAVAPSLIQDVKTRRELIGILEKSPSHALLRVNAALYVVNEKGEPIASLAEAFDCLGGRVIPLLSPTSDGAYDALAAHFATTKYADMMLLSDDAEKIAALKSVMPMLRTVLDLRRADTSDLASVVARAATVGTYVCLFPSTAVSSETSNYINHRYMLTWYEAADTTAAETARLVTAGAEGIITTDRAAVEECLTDRSVWAEGSLGRTVPIIGHQGSTFNPTTQPNTLGAFAWAIENGATLFELDVYLSADNVPVIMHDTTVDGTTDGTGKIEEMTLAQIKELWVDCHGDAAPERVPTLEEVFREYKDTGIIINIEIKSSKTALIPYIVELINEYEIWDQCRVCCFADYQTEAFHEQCPNVPVAVTSNSVDSFETLVERATRYEGACFVKFDKFNYDNMQKLAYRGIASFMWTPDADEDIYNTYAEGPFSLCLNYVNKISNVTATLKTYQNSYTLTAGESMDLALNATTYKGDAADTSAAEMVILSGNSSLSYENGKLTATEKGTATVMFRMPVKLGGTKITVYIYTAPVTVTVA